MKKLRKREDITGLFIPGGLFVGMGIGFLIDQLVAMMFIGLGSGFICMVIAKLIIKKK